MKNSETQTGLENSTARNQFEVHVLFITRDNISGKQTVPAVVRPKTETHDSRVDSGEFDINVKSLKEQVCQFQTQNVQQTTMSTEKVHNYQFPPVTMAETDCFTSKRQLSDRTGVQFSNKNSNNS